MKILDCTLRDGGYYTNWDFPEDLATSYLHAMRELPIDAVEVGYRSKPLKGYYGKYFYCPQHVLEQARLLLVGKKIAVMFNEKDTGVGELEKYLPACKGLVDIIRFAVDPDKIRNMPALIETVKGHGFETAINLMYASNYSERVDDLIAAVKTVEGADYLNLVDSYGGVYPDALRRMIQAVKSEARCEIGFHGHDNLELAFANALVALDAGCEWVDATVTGMGRGAGNVKTELLLTHIASRGLEPVDLDILSQIVTNFDSLKLVYGWGTNLPYMVSGASSLPQKDVMDWVTKRYYSMNSIIRALDNQRSKVEDNLKLPAYNPEDSCGDTLIIGGGPSVAEHALGLVEWIRKNNIKTIIHASSKNAKLFENLEELQIFCLIGNEGRRLEQIFDGDIGANCKCVLPPYPRKMGTYLPGFLERRASELVSVTFTEKFKDSHTSLAIQVASGFKPNQIWVAGYDGYPSSMNSKERDLFLENEFLFDRAKEQGMKMTAITPTTYSSLERHSIYQSI